MKEKFEEFVFKEIDYKADFKSGNVIKSNNAKIIGKSKISVEEESDEGVKVVIKKDEKDAIKEIKFVCSCGQSKSILLDYSEE